MIKPRRPKRGRPLTGPMRKKRVNVMLSSETATALRRIGGGNLSKGVEIATRLVALIT